MGKRVERVRTRFVLQKISKNFSLYLLKRRKQSQRISRSASNTGFTSKHFTRKRNKLVHFYLDYIRRTSFLIVWLVWKWCNVRLLTWIRTDALARNDKWRFCVRRRSWIERLQFLTTSPFVTTSKMWNRFSIDFNCQTFTVLIWNKTIKFSFVYFLPRSMILQTWPNCGFQLAFALGPFCLQENHWVHQICPQI